MKQLFTYLRTFILCMGLLNMSLIPTYVLAQDDTQTQSASSDSQSGEQQTSRTEVRQGEDGSSDFMNDLMDLVTMIGIGLLAKTMIMYEPITTDMMVAMAAGLIYIYGEIATLNETKDKMDSETFVLTVNEDGTKNNLQVEALERQKKMYDDLADMMDKKATIKKTAATGFAAAAAMAATSGAAISGASVACQTATGTYAATCAPPYNTTPCPCVAGAAAIVNSEGSATSAECTPGDSSQSQAQSIEVSNETTITTADASCSAVSGACTPLDNLRRMLTTSSSMGFTKSALISGAASVILEKLDLGPLKGLVIATFTSMSTYHDTMMASPYMRAVSFGVLAGLSYAGSAQSEKQAEKMRENSQIIQEMLNKTYELQDTNVAELQADSSLAENSTLEQEETPGLDTSVTQGNSLCDSADTQVASQEECSSFRTSIDESIARDIENGLDGVPAAVTGAATQTGGVVDGLSNDGLSETVLSDSAALSDNAQALMSLNKRIQEKVNRQLKKNGRPEVDFVGEAKKFEDNLKNSVIEALKSKPEETSKALAALRANRGFPEKDKESVEELKQKLSEVDESSIQSVTQGESSAFQLPDVGSGFDMSDLDSGGSGFTTNQEDKNIDGNVVNVDVDENLNTDGDDIVKNREVSIFKVISIRYLKSGIPKLIDRD